MSPRPQQPSSSRMSRTDRCSVHQELQGEDSALHRLLGDIIHTLEDVETRVGDLHDRMDALDEALKASGKTEERHGAALADLKTSVDSIRATVDSSVKVVTDLSSRIG